MLRTVLSRAMVVSAVLVLFTNLVVAAPIDFNSQKEMLDVKKVPLTLTHQGRLLDAADTPLNGVYTITYSIYDAAVGGNLLWLEDHAGVVVTDGLFSVTLGTTTPITSEMLTSDGGSGLPVVRSLQVQLSGQPPISPRTRLTSSPYAVAANSVAGDIQTSPNQVAIGDLDGDGFPELLVANDPSNARLAINSKGTSAKRTMATVQVKPDTSSSISCDVDADDDGVVDNSGSTEVDGSSATRRLESHNIGSSGQDGVEVTLRCTPDSITENRTLTENGVARITFKAKEGATLARRQTTLLYPDGGSSETEEVCDSAGASLKLTIDATPARISTNFTVGKQTQRALSSVACDSDNDGVDDNSVISTADVSSARLAIKTKGTGAQRTISCDTDSSAATLQVAADIDNDGVQDNSVVSESSVSGASLRVISLNGLPPGQPKIDNIALTANGTSSTVALAKGVAKVGLGVAGAVGVPGGSVISSKCLSASGLDSSSTEQSSDGSTATMRAINVKGTGSILRVASTVNDSGTVVIDSDDDGDGHAEARGIIAVKSASGSGAGSASSRMSYDSNDDGVADVAVEMEANADSASLRLNGLPPGVPTTGKISMTASPSGAHMSVGAAYCDGTNWVNASDRNSKENFQKVDGEELLNQLAELDITKWNYKNDKETEHIGPTAQDFKEKFGVGSDGKSISTIDPSGIALAAIKELYSQLSELQKRDKAQAEQIQRRDVQLEALQKEIKKLREEIRNKN